MTERSPDPTAKRRTTLVAEVGLAIGAAVPLLFALVKTATLRAPIYPSGDQAMLEIATRHAARLHQLLGPYSRYPYWKHPGPSWFYLMVPPYSLAGGHGTALYVAVIAVHALFAIAAVAVAARAGGLPLAAAAAAVLLLAQHSLGPSIWQEPWNPWAILMPVALFLVLCGWAATGRWPALLWALVAGSFVVQTHVSTAAMVAAAIVASLAAGGRVLLRSRPWPLRPATVVPIVVFALMWTPPLIEQATHWRGNVVDLAAFFVRGHGRHPSGGQAVRATGTMLVTLTSGNGDERLRGQRTLGNDGVGDVAAVGLALAAGATLVVMGRRRGKPLVTGMGAVSVAASGAAAASATRVVGPLYEYLLIWVVLVPVPLVLGYVALLPRRALGAATAVALLGGLLLGWSDVRQVDRAYPTALVQSANEVRAAWLLLRPAMPEHHGDVLLRFTTDHQWSTGAGLALRLEKRGWRARFTPRWSRLLGDEFQAHRPPSVEVVVAETGRTRPPPGAEGSRLLGDTGASAIFLRTRHE